MITKTRAIVFRKLRYSETSIIADLYTEEHGLMSYIISGVRSPKAKVSASLFEIMSIVHIVAYHSDRKKLHRIKEIKPAYVFQTIPFDVRKNAILMFMAELCAKTIRETEANPALFACIQRYLWMLDESESAYLNLHLEFMVALADELGFGLSFAEGDPSGVFDLLTGSFVDVPPQHPYIISEGEDLRALLGKMAGLNGSLDFDRTARNRLIDHLLTYFKLHIDHMPAMQSHEILREVL